MEIKIRVTMRSEKAGRDHNEDDCFIDSNLSDKSDGKEFFRSDITISLGEKGALLVVCDGMGGTNAGEVASASAINTMKEWFTADKLTEEVLTFPKTYIEKAITDADRRIKEEGKKDKEKEGMGTTIVLAWLYGENVYIGWCGDSRAYKYNPESGLKQLSHDHSYVQKLIDDNELTEEMAFDHPDSNIITKSLGDPRQKIKPDVESFELCEDDIILLCSDGLWGVLRNKEIESVMAQHTASMVECRDALRNESEKVGWTDNVTVVLCQIVSGGIKSENQKGYLDSTIKQGNRIKKLLTLIISFLIMLVIGFGIGFFTGNGKLVHSFHKGQDINKDKKRTEELKNSIKKIKIENLSEADSTFIMNMKQAFEINPDTIISPDNGKRIDSLKNNSN